MRDAETGFISKKHTVQLYNPDGKLGETICVFVSVCLHGSVFLPSSLSLTLPLCHSLFPSVTRSSPLSLTLPLCHSLIPSVTHSSSLSLTLPLCHSLFPSVTPSPSLSLTHPLCNSLSLYVIHSSSLSLALPLCHSLFLSVTHFPLCHSLLRSLSLSCLVFPCAFVYDVQGSVCMYTQVFDKCTCVGLTTCTHLS